MDPSSLSCEINIVQAKNVENLKSHDGKLFVRFYLSSGNNRRVQLNTKEVPLKSSDMVMFWNESFSLECLGTEDSINNLRQQTVVFELRRRRGTSPILGKLGGSSQLVGRAEIPWRTVMESPKMEMEKWVSMDCKKKGCVRDGVKPPSVKIGMKARVPGDATRKEVVDDDIMKKKMKKRRNGGSNDECGCCKDTGCKSCGDYDIFALVAAFEAL